MELCSTAKSNLILTKVKIPSPPIHLVKLVLQVSSSIHISESFLQKYDTAFDNKFNAFKCKTQLKSLKCLKE